MNKRRFYIYFTIIAILLIISSLIASYATGIFQKSSIDERDLNYWNYTQGLILNANEIFISGNNQTCWLLIHSYTATPLEMKELAFNLSEEFNDTVYAPLLIGHSSLPSKINNLNLSVWYSQIEQVYSNLSNSCDNINVLGSSFGSALSLRIAEEKEVKNIYALDSFLIIKEKGYSPISRMTLIRVFAETFGYNKKRTIAQINDKESLKNHIAYWNMPYAPIKNSFLFLEEVKSNLHNITSPIFIAHSKEDTVASFESANLIFNNVSSKIKELKEYNKSNHVLLKDLERQDLIKDIINFEKSNR